MNDPKYTASIRVVGVCGSLNPTGKTRAALSAALEGSAEYEAETRLIELRDYELVFFGSVSSDDYPEDVPGIVHSEQRPVPRWFHPAHV